MFKRIVVPLDGSELAAQSLPHAEEFAQLTGASLHLLCVINTGAIASHGAWAFGANPSGVQQLIDDETRAATVYIERIAGQLTADGLTVSTAIRHGVPGSEILGGLRPGDLVVMATHGRGGVSRWLLGSVAEEIARHSPVPVLLIRVATDLAAHATAGQAPTVSTTPVPVAAGSASSSMTQEYRSCAR